MMKPGPKKSLTASWKAYKQAVKARCSLLLIWLGPEMNWHGRAGGQRGRRAALSNAAIQLCLIIKCLFNLPLRQAMGMTQRLPILARLDWTAPDDSTAHHREKQLHVAIEATANSIGDAPMLPGCLGRIPLEDLRNKAR